jgi:TonB-dependent receptor
MKKLLISLALITISVNLVAQKGFVRGKITDGESGEALYGATVLKQGTTIGVISDFDGNYSLALEPGSHTISLTFISFKTQVIENVVVTSGEVTKLDFVMLPDVSTLDEIIVSGQAMRDTESAMMTLQRKSANLLDGVSNQTFRNTGDRDLAVAMGRVTGVSIQSGKHIYVRGLGDRYTRTTLNGMTIPGLDPDRNDVQMDIFPTSVLENVIVYKTFSPNLSGDFTGGMVDVETKNFPEERTTTISLGFRFNPQMNLQNDFIGYQGGSRDWLGMDDGTRELPFASSTVVPDESENNPKLEQLTRSLNPTLGVERKRNFLNSSFSFAHGNQINKEKITIGYNVVLNYQNRYEYYKDAEFGNYSKSPNVEESEFDKEEVRTGVLARNNVLWSGLVGGAIKFGNHSITATIFRTQNGVSEAAERTNQNFDATQATLYQNILTYSQRSVTNGILSGTHQLGKLRLDWKNSYTAARTYDPDFRTTSISITNPEPSLSRGDGAGINRFWRDLNEFNENLKLDFTLPYAHDNKLQFGVSGLYKDRTFDVENYIIDATAGTEITLSPNDFLKQEHVWTAAEQSGFFVVGNNELANQYKSNSNVYAVYMMTEMKLFDRLKATYGVRAEKSDMYYTGQDIWGKKFNNEHTFDELDFLPSLNLNYGLTDMSNIRMSYGRTLARPSFKEKSTAQIFDPITSLFFNGNIDLRQTTIDNYDLRYENFFGKGDMVSVSGFYKKFDGHIEMVFYNVARNNVKPRNAGDSYVYGAELEIRKNLEILSPTLAPVTFGTNLTIAKSAVDITQIAANDSEGAEKKTEFESRQENARSNEYVSKTRAMGGQSPYIINTYLNYSSIKGSLNANLSYNVQGESLLIIGVGDMPDVYSQPFQSLNFNIYKDFGRDNTHRLTVGVNNLLDAQRKDLYKGYGGAEAVYSHLKPGRTFALTYGIRL